MFSVKPVLSCSDQSKCLGLYKDVTCNYIIVLCLCLLCCPCFLSVFGFLQIVHGTVNIESNLNESNSSYAYTFYLPTCKLRIVTVQLVEILNCVICPTQRCHLHQMEMLEKNHNTEW